MNKEYVVVARVGMFTPIGHNTEMTTASVNAGINMYRESPFRNKKLKPIKAALIPDGALPELHEDIAASTQSYHHRQLIKIADPAIRECVKDFSLGVPLPLFLGCPEAIPGSPANTSSTIIKQLALQTEVAIDFANSRTLFLGRTGGLLALDLAMEYFKVTNNEFALVGGVDTCKFALHRLGTLDKENRLSATNIMDGFAFGEAAGFLLLASQKAAQKYNLADCMKLYKPGFGREEGHRYSTEPYLGEGLSRAVRRAIDNSPANPINVIYSSMNGESLNIKEYGVAQTRNHTYFEDNMDHHHPGDCFGDIGAAFGPVNIGLMSQNLRGNGICYCSSDGEMRGAVYATSGASAI